MISQIPPSLPPSLFVHANFTGREAEPNRHDARSSKMLASLAPIAMTPLTPSEGVPSKAQHLKHKDPQHTTPNYTQRNQTQQSPKQVTS